MSAFKVGELLTPDSVGSMGAQDADAVAITGGSIAGITDLAVADGGAGSGGGVGELVTGGGGAAGPLRASAGTGRVIRCLLGGGD